MVDAGQLPLVTASDLSYMLPGNFSMLYELMQEGLIPSGAQARQLKQAGENWIMEEDEMRQILAHRVDPGKVSNSGRAIRRYFPESYTGEQIEAIVMRLLEEWRRSQENTL